MLDVARNRPGSLRSQLEQALRDTLREGRLEAGARLPSSRTLATDLGISRGVVSEVYGQLVAEGYLVARSGSRTRVAAGASSAPSPLPPRGLKPQPAWNFQPGVPDLALFPRGAWAGAVRDAVATLPDGRLGYPDPRGAVELRTELASYLRRVRAVSADPDRIVVCSGFRQGIALLCAVLRRRGTSKLAIEDPGSPAARPPIAAAGMEAVPVGVDTRGLSISKLLASGAGAALVTPAHQFPTGVVLAPERRSGLLDWARSGGIVIEDDYDAEFRYDHAPVGALQGLAPERVVYAGSVSKTLAPALRLGWLLLPAELVDEVAEAKRCADLGSPVIEQLAFARLLARGAYDRHLRRARRRYRAKRDALVGALSRNAPWLSVGGIAAGLHVVANLPHDSHERALADAAAERSVGVYALSDYRIATADEPRGLVLGYGGLSEPAITAGVAMLAKVLR